MQNPLKSIVEHLGNLKPQTAFAGFTTVCSLILAGVVAFGNYQRHDGVNETKSADLERRIVLLESDRATRLEVHSLAESMVDFKKDTHERLSHLEDLLLQDLRSHHP